MLYVFAWSTGIPLPPLLGSSFNSYNGEARATRAPLPYSSLTSIHHLPKNHPTPFTKHTIQLFTEISTSQCLLTNMHSHVTRRTTDFTPTCTTLKNVSSQMLFIPFFIATGFFTTKRIIITISMNQLSRRISSYVEKG